MTDYHALGGPTRVILRQLIQLLARPMSVDDALQMMRENAPNTLARALQMLTDVYQQTGNLGRAISILDPRARAIFSAPFELSKLQTYCGDDAALVAAIQKVDHHQRNNRKLTGNTYSQLRRNLVYSLVLIVLAGATALLAKTSLAGLTEIYLNTSPSAEHLLIRPEVIMGRNILLAILFCFVAALLWLPRPLTVGWLRFLPFLARTEQLKIRLQSLQLLDSIGQSDSNSIKELVEQLSGLTLDQKNNLIFGLNNGEFSTEIELLLDEAEASYIEKSFYNINAFSYSLYALVAILIGSLVASSYLIIFDLAMGF